MTHALLQHFCLTEKINQIASSIINPNLSAAQFLEEKNLCYTRDVFSGKLQNYSVAYEDPLLLAVIGELGNNAFDHNLGRWKDVSGLYFNTDIAHQIILIDRGQGLFNSLKKVRPEIKNDLQAIQTAFTEVVSGRSPEQRGNGLKFVRTYVEKNNWKLYFQSGYGACAIENPKSTYFESVQPIHGCMILLEH